MKLHRPQAFLLAAAVVTSYASVAVHAFAPGGSAATGGASMSRYLMISGAELTAPPLPGR